MILEFLILTIGFYVFSGVSFYLYSVVKTWEYTGLWIWRFENGYIGLCLYPKWLLFWIEKLYSKLYQLLNK